MRRFAAGLLLGVVAAVLLVAATATVSGPIQFGPEFTVNPAGQVDLDTTGLVLGSAP